VHSTLSDHEVRGSELARGHCRGVIVHAGGGKQAFVIRFDAGLVAFLVERVVDIVLSRAGEVMRVPAFALQRAELFAGLLLDSAALAACEDVRALAAMSRQAIGGAVTAGAGDLADCSMLIYQLAVETTTPLQQISEISEILPYRPSSAKLAGTGPLLGLLAHRGHAIPVLCLRQLLGGAPAGEQPLASVLVAERAEDLVGFAVPGLRTIEQTRWQPPLRNVGSAAIGAAAGQSLALVGSGTGERLLPVLDLGRLARGLRSPLAA